ncbi:MAG: hypothetical protein WAK71_22975 [Streptosporangiaceae bacterium]
MTLGTVVVGSAVLGCCVATAEGFAGWAGVLVAGAAGDDVGGLEAAGDAGSWVVVTVVQAASPIVAAEVSVAMMIFIAHLPHRGPTRC